MYIHIGAAKGEGHKSEAQRRAAGTSTEANSENRSDSGIDETVRGFARAVRAYRNRGVVGQSAVPPVLSLSAPASP